MTRRRDDERLARAFGVPGRRIPLFASRSVREGLRELDAWGFKTDGYRDWLLASEPTLDIELVREVALSTLSTSLHALDPRIVVEAVADRVMRVVTRPVALPASTPEQRPLHVGDRRLLHELYERVLVPLHADAGIVAVHMGDRARLQSSAPRGAASDSGAFRAALAAPPALQALVDETRELPREAETLDHRTERVFFAIGDRQHGVGTALLGLLAGAVQGTLSVPLYGTIVGAVGGLVGGTFFARAWNRRNASRVASAYKQPFPIEGYDLWLLSGRPLFDIELERPVDRAWLEQRLATLLAFSVGDNASIRWVEDFVWLDDTCVRIETRPAFIEPRRGVTAFYGGSHVMFEQLVSDVLVPLNKQARIVAVRMGGFINRRT